MNALLSVTPIIVESARLSLLNIKQQACPSILLKLDSKSFQTCSFLRLNWPPSLQIDHTVILVIFLRVNANYVYKFNASCMR